MSEVDVARRAARELREPREIYGGGGAVSVKTSQYAGGVS